MQVSLQELTKDRMDREIETEEEVAQLVITLPFVKDHFEMGPKDKVVLLWKDNHRTKKFYKAKLKMLLANIEEKEKEAQIVQN